MIGKVTGRLALAGAACVAYGFAEARAFRVRRVSVPVLPAGSEKLRVLHVSDIHLTRGQHAKHRFVSALAGLEPDLVVNTGDNIAHANALEPLLRAYGRLLDVPGVFVFGSNDYTAPKFTNPLSYLARSTSHHGLPEDREHLPTQELRAALASGAWQDINEQRATIEVRGVRLEFRGTDDPHLHHDDYAKVAGRPAKGTDLAIGVTHAPYARVLDAMAVDGLPLLLAGHTHGGQVCLPWWGALTTNCDLPPAQAKGLSRYHAGDHTSWLHVSAGVGTSPFAPYRFACPPEVTLLTLTPGPNG
ncbi:MAG: metallophosphoesterase family protein [Actinobacteria bacterium]|nr:metallophosphoesterase family protein [Actinomycetota bacterium]MCA0434883.1 metallophosphoesterase family protein [Actinomycetota bacterium]